MMETELLQALVELKAAHGQAGRDNPERIAVIQKELTALWAEPPGGVQVGISRLQRGSKLAFRLCVSSVPGVEANQGVRV